MIEKKNKPGRPRVKNPLTAKERRERHKAKNELKARREVKFVLSDSVISKLESLMEANGYSLKEKSDFITALILEKSGGKFFGKPLIGLENDTTTSSE